MNSESWRLTRITLPVKVVLGVAVALEILPDLVASWAVGEGHMIVSDIVEEVDLVLLEHETGGDRMNRSVTPSFVEEAPVLIEGFEEIKVGLGAEPVKVADLEVGPLTLVLAGKNNHGEVVGIW